MFDDFIYTCQCILYEYACFARNNNFSNEFRETSNQNAVKNCVNNAKTKHLSSRNEMNNVYCKFKKKSPQIKPLNHCALYKARHTSEMNTIINVVAIMPSN